MGRASEGDQEEQRGTTTFTGHPADEEGSRRRRTTMGSGQWPVASA